MEKRTREPDPCNRTFGKEKEATFWSLTGTIFRLKSTFCAFKDLHLQFPYTERGIKRAQQRPGNYAANFACVDGEACLHSRLLLHCLRYNKVAEAACLHFYATC